MKLGRLLSEQQGAVAIMVAVSAIVLLGIAAFVIDFGFAWVTTNQLQNAADAGALAGARALGKFYCPDDSDPSKCKSKADQDDTTIDEVSSMIKDAVRDVVSKNYAAQSSISVDDGDIEIGTWVGSTKTFTANATPPDAVRVRTRRDSVTNGPIQTFLGNIFGVSSFSLAKPATAALTGLGSVSKGDIQVPLGVSKNRDCSNPVITLQKTGTSCAGWTSFFDTNTSNSNMQDIIDGMRTNTIQAPAAKIGDAFYYNGGTQSGLFNAFYNLYMAKRDPVTRDWQVLLPVYNDSGTDCSNPNTSLTIVGFATMVFSDKNSVDSSDDPIGCTASNAKEPFKTCPLSQDVLRGKLVCTVEPGRGGGSDDWSSGSIPGLVQ